MSQPITHKQLAQHWTNLDRGPAMIAGITQNHVIFQRQIAYPVSDMFIESLPNVKHTTRSHQLAWYRATVMIPNDHNIFDTIELVDSVYPSFAIQYTTFTFDYYGNKIKDSRS